MNYEINHFLKSQIHGISWWSRGVWESGRFGRYFLFQNFFNPNTLVVARTEVVKGSMICVVWRWIEAQVIFLHKFQNQNGRWIEKSTILQNFTFEGFYSGLGVYEKVVVLDGTLSGIIFLSVSRMFWTF